jgi:hypothetical protein
MKKITALFVGGPMDRKHIEVEKRHYFRAIDAVEQGISRADVMSEGGHFRTVEYRLYEFDGHFIYALYPMTVKDMFALLIGQYANNATATVAKS